MIRTDANIAGEVAGVMLNTLRAVIRDGSIELFEPVDLPEGTALLATPLAGLVQEETLLFWERISDLTLAAVWDNTK
jgi:hypothetical protein